MADDVDPNQSLPSEMDTEDEARRSAGVVGSGGFGAPSTTRVFEPVEIAMVEIEVVEFETFGRQPEPELEFEAEREPEPEPETEPEIVVLQATALEVVKVDEAEVEPEVGTEVEPDDSMEPVDALPTMADLDRVASELDEIDARLAALDEQRP